MNNFSATTLVLWETRNPRHAKKASDWCRDYGLHKITRTVWIGQLYPKERSQLHTRFQGLFSAKTEKVAFSAICQSCFDVALINARIKSDAVHVSQFELVQVPVTAIPAILLKTAKKRQKTQ
jgi:hypothetical protein